MQCPNCDVTLMMTDRQGIEIDYCPQCRGIWLDRGELDKIIERAAMDSVVPQPASARPSREVHRDTAYGHHGKHRKKKSLLSELFDF